MKKILFIAGFITVSLLLMGVSNAHTALKPYTILIYMNGSDLESDFGAATDDLVEMLDAGLEAKNANVIILTGGSNRWKNAVIPEYEVVMWQLVDGHMYEVMSFGFANMGDAQTLRDFIQIGMQMFPAEKTGLILWDHGGGSIAGFGHDELFMYGTLSLLDMDWAFHEAGLHQKPMEFIGFDACLMATVEMAIIAEPYARYFIASEDTEPGDGWDYRFLGALNKNPHINGAVLGKIIVDTFMDFYGENSDEVLTLSVVDLQYVQGVMDAMGALTRRAKINFTANFPALAIHRANTKTFGEGSPRDNNSDMVDIGDMVKQLQYLFPQEVKAVFRALQKAVIYERNNADIPLYGLSTFYIYGGINTGEASLQTYTNLMMDEHYTHYLHRFFQHLTRNPAPSIIVNNEWVRWEAKTEDVFHMVGLSSADIINEQTLWPAINGHAITLFPISSQKKGRLYAIPVHVNGRDADLITTDTEIKGIRHRTYNLIQKGYDPIRRGDVISFYTLSWDTLTDHQQWVRSRPFTAQGTLQLTWELASPCDFIGERLTDSCQVTIYSLPAHQRKAFSTNKANCGFAQTAAVCPGVNTATRPLPSSRVYPAARMAAGALKYGSLSYFATSPCAAA